MEQIIGMIGVLITGGTKWGDCDLEVEINTYPHLENKGEYGEFEI